MGKTCVIYSIKPENPEVDLEKIKAEVQKLENFDNLEIKPFMFGMNQVLATFILPEGVGPDSVEEKLSKIAGAGSVSQEACTLI